MSAPGRPLVEVSDGVWVATSRKDSTTSTLVVDGSDVLLIDPAWLPDEMDGLADEVARRGWTVAAGFSTHAHHDHLLWHPAFGEAPRWASPVTCALAAEHREDLLGNLGEWPWPSSFGQVSPVIGSFPFGGEVVVHDGHSPGHSALWFADRGVLVAGDMLSDVELPLPFWPDDVPSYLEGLDRLAPYVTQARILIPGHGTPTSSPMARLDADRRYLDDTIAGRPVDDPRLGNPGMAANHAHLVSILRD